MSGKFPRQVLLTPAVKRLRDRIIDGAGAGLSMAELLDLIGSHEQLRAIALSRTNQLRATEEERARLQGQIEMIARAR